LKILIIHTRYRFHGGEDSVVEQEIELLKQKHTVDSLFFQNQSGIKGLIQFLTFIWNIKSARKVKKKIKEFKPDIIHIHNWHYASGPLIIRTINKLNIPIVHTLHNYRLLCPSATLLNNEEIFLKSLHQFFPYSAVKNRVYRNSWIQTFWLALGIWFHKKIGTWKKINKYVCLSQNSLDLFNKSNFGVPKTSFVIKPNFTVNNKINDLDIVKGTHFLFIGRLSKEKGIENLLNTFKNSSIKLKIAGDGPMKQEILQLSNSHKNIEYLGTITKEQIGNELQSAQALIFCSVWFETFGMVIIEAFSYKCAVITSNIGAPKSIVKKLENGLHFDYKKTDALKNAIKEWLNFSESKKNSIRLRAYESYLNLYSFEKQFDYFEYIYKV